VQLVYREARNQEKGSTSIMVGNYNFTSDIYFFFRFFLHFLKKEDQFENEKWTNTETVHTLCTYLLVHLIELDVRFVYVEIARLVNAYLPSNFKFLCKF